MNYTSVLPQDWSLAVGPEGGDPLGPFQLPLWGGCSRIQEQLTEGHGCQPIAGRSWRSWENLGRARAVAITEAWDSTLRLDARPRKEEKNPGLKALWDGFGVARAATLGSYFFHSQQSADRKNPEHLGM